MLGKKTRILWRADFNKTGDFWISGFLSHTKTGYFGQAKNTKKHLFNHKLVGQIQVKSYTYPLKLAQIVSEPKNEGLEDDFPFQVGDS